jgi:hypothetical protein
VAWSQVGYVALAFDPLFLFAFATEHPYVRRTRLHKVALVWLAVAGATCAVSVILDPPSIVWSLAPTPRTPARILLFLGELCFGYTMAWATSIGSLRRAPTDGLARRARWSCLAVGVAVVPRLPLTPLEEMQDAPAAHDLAGNLLYLVGLLVVAAALVVPAWFALRGARQERSARRIVVAVGGLAAALLVLHAALGYLDWSFNYPFALRWTAFSGILVYAVLAHQVIRFPAWARRVLPALAALVAGLAAAATALSVAGGDAAPWVALAIGVVAATAVAWLARRWLGWAERNPESGAPAERRLALYGAAVESALAGGTPNRLAGARRHLGLSRDEARVVEDLVRRSLARAQPALRRGDEPLPGLVVVKPLKGGAQARTFLARREPGPGLAVVKQLPGNLLPGARRRLWMELDALRSVDHPAVPRLLDYALDPVACLACEHVPGPTLAEALQKGPLPPKRVETVARDLLGALAAVHGIGLAHGDVKPANIILGSAGTHLIDFGLAGDAPVPPRATLASEGEDPPRPAGTLEYMAPELAATGVPTAGSDVFAAGLVVLECLQGRPARKLEGLAVFHALERVRRTPVIPQGAPAAWRPFLEASLAHDAGRRPSAARLASLVPGAATP